jgi:hypothetical protein
MFCDRCQDILNLDILLSTLMNFNPGGPKTQRRAHHKNFADLVASAKAGCTICSLVCADPEASSILTGSESGQVYFFLHPDDLLAFDFDILHESEHSGRRSKALANIRLSTNEGMCICYKA